MDIVITGATSMLGVATINSLLKDSKTDVIYAIVRKNSANVHRVPSDSRIKIIECDLKDLQSLPSLIGKKCDIFYHFAWSGTGHNRGDVRIQIDNIRYTYDSFVSAMALGCSTYVGAGSQAEYGAMDGSVVDETTVACPNIPYGIAKYAAGELLRNMSKNVSINCIWVRIFSVYGFFDKDTSLISSILRNRDSGADFNLSAGTHLWDYLFASDAGDAFRTIGFNATEDDLICLASGDPRSLKYFIEEIDEILHPLCNFKYGAKDVAPINLNVDISKIKTKYGWEPKISFKEGIALIAKE